MRGDEQSTRGWRSKRYGQREPALSLACELDAASAIFWTILGPPLRDIKFYKKNALLTGRDWSAEVKFEGTLNQHRIVAARLTDAMGIDQLDVN